MRVKIYSVYDCKAEAYLQPMFMQSNGVAVRSFTAAVSDSKHDFCKFAEDYTLFELGEFDDADASFHMLATPNSLGKASEFKASLVGPASC